MNVQAILPQIDKTVNLPVNNTKCGDEFGKIMNLLSEEADIQEMKNFLDKKFNVNTVVAEYSCETTDAQAESYDLYMLEKYDMSGGRNVVISKKVLLRMKEDSRFRQKVFKSIEDMPWSGKMTGGMVKSTGVFIHEDGTGGYWMEFDWGDEEEGEKNKSNRPKILYSNNLQDNNLNSQIYNEFSNIGVQADSVIALMGTFYNHKKEK